jgi:uncharacterized protein
MVGEDDRSELAIGRVDTGIREDRVSALRALKDRVYAACSDCALRARCQHHCACRQIAVSGELGKLSRVYCEIEAQVIEQSDRLAEILWNENCSAFRSLYYDHPWQPAPGATVSTS